MSSSLSDKMNSNRTRGRKFEYRIRDLLQKNGWIVFRSAGSHTSADLIGVKPGPKVILVQTKATEELYLSPSEKADLASYKTELGAVPLVIHRKGRKWRIHFYTLSLENKLISVSLDQLHRWGILK